MEIYVIAAPCIDVKDKACVDVCPVDCIYEGKDQLFIDPNECIGCGACEPECPVDAIFERSFVPEQWTDFIDRNAEFFSLKLPGSDRPASRRELAAGSAR